MSTIRSTVRALTDQWEVDDQIVASTPPGLRGIITSDTRLTRKGVAEIDRRLFSNDDDIIDEKAFDSLVKTGKIIGSGDVYGQIGSVYGAMMNIIASASATLVERSTDLEVLLVITDVDAPKTLVEWTASRLDDFPDSARVLLVANRYPGSRNETLLRQATDLGWRIAWISTTHTEGRNNYSRALSETIRSYKTQPTRVVLLTPEDFD